MDISIQAPSKIYIGETVTINIHGASAKSVTSFEWSFNHIVLREIEKDKLSITINPLLSGDFEIKYKAVIIKDSEMHTYELTQTIAVGVRGKEKTNKVKVIPLSLNETEEREEIDPYDHYLVKNKTYRYQEEPHFIKRNARYRGHRESEKVLNSHREQLTDIYYSYEDVAYTEKMIDASINLWFSGRNGENTTKRVISEEKVYQATPEEHRFLLNNERGVSRFEHIMVRLNQEPVDPSWYRIDGFYLVLDITNIDPSLESADLFIAFDSVFIFRNDDSQGLSPIMQRLKSIDERIEEMNRRYMNYENAYK